MLMDALLNFVPPGFPLSIVGAAGVDFPSPNVIDILGTGVGTAPASIIGRRTLFGADKGIGEPRPYIEAVVGTAFVTANSATLNVAFQGAPDTGVGGGYQPGTWQTYAETGEITAAQLTAAQVIARLDFEAAFPQNNNPRFLRLLFQVPAAVNFSAGTIAFAIVTSGRDDQSNRNATSNFTVV